MAVVLQAQISRVLPDAHVHATTGAIPYAIGVKLAHAFGNTFWWSLALCGVALIPSLFLPDNPTEAAPKDEGAIAMVE